MNEEVIYLSEEDIHEAFDLEENEELDYSGIVGDSTRFYLKEIAQIPLLSFTQEKELASRISKGDESAVDELVQHNLRLVVSVAKKYTGCGLSLLDLIQEGNIGLIEAARKYDASKGWRFSTYAGWWIRQKIGRALSDQSRSIRVPANIAELVSRIKKCMGDLIQKLGRTPTEEEIAQVLKVDVDKVKVALDMSQVVSSLDVPVSDDDEVTIGDLQADESAQSPFDQMVIEANREIIDNVFNTLSKKESDILHKRFGIGYDHTHTLEEIGKQYGVTRERIRQIEVKALRKMRHPIRLKMLQEAF